MKFVVLIAHTGHTFLTFKHLDRIITSFLINNLHLNVVRAINLITSTASYLINYNGCFLHRVQTEKIFFRQFFCLQVISII